MTFEGSGRTAARSPAGLRPLPDGSHERHGALAITGMAAVDNPDTIADRIVRFAEVAGRENVVASADCGFSSQATYAPEIHPKIVWAKLESLAEGARRATDRLW